MEIIYIIHNMSYNMRPKVCRKRLLEFNKRLGGNTLTLRTLLCGASKARVKLWKDFVCWPNQRKFKVVRIECCVQYSFTRRSKIKWNTMLIQVGGFYTNQEFSCHSFVEILLSISFRLTANPILLTCPLPKNSVHKQINKNAVWKFYCLKHDFRSRLRVFPGGVFEGKGRRVGLLRDRGRGDALNDVCDPSWTS